MIAVDTNILVRALTDDSSAPEQTRQARELIMAAKQVFVPQMVQIEFAWVLERAYNLNKLELVKALQLLSDSPTYLLQHEAHFSQALALFKESNAGFADSIIHVESMQEGAVLWTFDRKLSNQNKVVRMTAESLAGYLASNDNPTQH